MSRLKKMISSLDFDRFRDFNIKIEIKVDPLIINRMPSITTKKLPSQQTKQYIYKTPEKQSTVPRNYSPDKKPKFSVNIDEMPSLKINLFNRNF